DSGIDANGVAHEERLDGARGAHLAQLLDGALPVFRRAELLHRLLLQPADAALLALLFAPADAELVEKSHGSSESDVAPHVISIELGKGPHRFPRLRRVGGRPDLQDGVAVDGRL